MDTIITDTITAAMATAIVMITIMIIVTMTTTIATNPINKTRAKKSFGGCQNSFL